MDVLERRIVYAIPRGLCYVHSNKYQNNTRVCVSTVRRECTYIILFLKRRNQSINNDKKGDLYTSVYILLMTSQSIADDVTMTRQLWRDHVNGDISSLDIDFIHGDIHEQSCKNIYYKL